jgi:hypothetical protein
MILGRSCRASVADQFPANSTTMPAPHFCRKFSTYFTPRRFDSTCFSSGDHAIEILLLLRHKRFIYRKRDTYLIHNVPDPSLDCCPNRHSRHPVIPPTRATTHICFCRVIAFDPCEPMDRQSVSPDRVSLFDCHAVTSGSVAAIHSLHLASLLASPYLLIFYDSSLRASTVG